MAGKLKSFAKIIDSKNMKMQSLQRRALSEVLPEGGRSSRRREEARQVEFVRVGQALKLDTIVKGDAPTSLANTGLFRRSVISTPDMFVCVS